MDKGNFIYVSQTTLDDLNKYYEANGNIPGWKIIADYNDLGGFYKVSNISEDKILLDKLSGPMKGEEVPRVYFVAHVKLPKNLSDLINKLQKEVLVDLDLRERILKGKIKKEMNGNYFFEKFNE